MKTFQQFLDEKSGVASFRTKANSPTRIMARGCPKPAGPANLGYRSLAVRKAGSSIKFF